MDSDPDPSISADTDPDPSIFVITFKTPTKNLFFIKKFFCLLLFEGTFTSFSKIKSQKEVGITVFLTIFCLMIEGFGSGAGSGSIHLTRGSGSGSRRPKKIWIRRIRIRIRIRNTEMEIEIVRKLAREMEIWSENERGGDRDS
jgi:hypothetical protein